MILGVGAMILEVGGMKVGVGATELEVVAILGVGGIEPRLVFAEGRAWSRNCSCSASSGLRGVGFIVPGAACCDAPLFWRNDSRRTRLAGSSAPLSAIARFFVGLTALLTACC